MTAEHSFLCSAKDTGAFDVVVCGGGPAGIAAAISSAREGAKTLLVEQAGYLGGAGTQSLVGVWLGSFTRDHKHKVVAGIFQEIVDLLVAEGAATRAEDDRPNRSRHVGYGAIHGATIPFEFEPYKRILEQLAIREGVKLLYFTSFLQTDIADGHIKGVFLHGKSGFSYVAARSVVDATGDADVARSCGCPIVIGREEDGMMTPGTLIFRIEDVDSLAWEDYCNQTGDVRLTTIISSLKTKGKWTFPFDTVVLCEMPHRGSFFVNALCQCGVDGTDDVSLTEASIQQRSEAAILMDFLKTHVPGFANARMVATASRIGIRETRRIIGEYTLAVSDMIQGTLFQDTIALTGFGWDLSDPKKPSHQPMFGKNLGHSFSEIPYRCLVPKGIDNLIVAGRCISVERDALGPVRIQPACFAMGQAAGIAAAWNAGSGVHLNEINTDALRNRLLELDAIVSCDAELDVELVQSWTADHKFEIGATSEPASVEQKGCSHNNTD